ncbi:restriction endonuclease [Pseudalkalibacillus salsuginis]|uniref:restriction endonuclease n=1 Tax=Pseudalkalibacillus salsuginis TaxID=2910972 RepID=UPI001F38A86C|nr:restriction endonuclease [Pseudalkalibacillus salsuginis]MCF6409587.1 restriction endonuclease [Pseudalkalibacillus salsuginis]
MAIPDYQSFMYPLLELLQDEKEHTLQESYVYLANYFQLTDEEKEDILPSGKQLVYHNRIGWARTYLKKAGLLRTVRRGTFVITDRGRMVLQDPSVTEINRNYLLRYKEFQDFQKKKTINEFSDANSDEEKALTPQEQLEESYKELQRQISEEILERVKGCTPEFFERLVVELLVEMGYGGSIQDAGRAIGRSGDEGIDGIIKEDVLGLDMIYVQAKRWEGVVGRPEIQKFAGSLEGQRAKKGVFITTSDFTEGAKDYVNRIEKKIILINGTDLAEYMFKYDIGVSKVSQYTIKKVDLDYFEE